jgi:hypothetical protein
MTLVTDGKVGFKEVEKAFQSMTAEGGMFFNMMAEQTKTTGGQLSMLGDSYEQLKVNIGKSQTGIIASTVKWANEFVSKMSDAFAQGNIMAENYAKNGAEQFGNFFSSWRDMMYEFRTGKDAKLMMLDYQKELYSEFVTTPAATLNEAITNQTELINRLTNLRKDYNKGLIDETEFSRKRASIYGALGEVKGQIGLLKTAPSTTTAAAMGGAADSTTKAKGGTGTNVVESRGVQNFNIQIKEFGSVTLNTTNIKEGANQIKEQVAQALIEAVNDFSLMATK